MYNVYQKCHISDTELDEISAATQKLSDRAVHMTYGLINWC